MRSPMTLISLIVLAALLVVLGVAFQLGMFFPKHHAVSKHAILAFVLAAGALVGASFARPRET